jgi:hypothetical protein
LTKREIDEEGNAKNTEKIKLIQRALNIYKIELIEPAMTELLKNYALHNFSCLEKAKNPRRSCGFFAF